MKVDWHKVHLAIQLAQVEVDTLYNEGLVSDDSDEQDRLVRTYSEIHLDTWADRDLMEYQDQAL